MRLVAVGPRDARSMQRGWPRRPGVDEPFGRFGQERDGPHKQLVLHGPARPLCCAFFCRRLRHGAPKGWPSDLDITKEAWLVWSPVGLRLFEASTPLIHSNMHMPSYQVVAWPPHGEGARLFTLQQFSWSKSAIARWRRGPQTVSEVPCTYLRVCFQNTNSDNELPHAQLVYIVKTFSRPTMHPAAVSSSDLWPHLAPYRYRHV